MAEDPNPAYLKLVDIAQRSRKTAVGLPSQQKLKSYWTGVGFTIFGQRYVSPMAEVAEIIPVPKYTHVPGVLPWVRGVANVRGRLLPLMDLATFLFHQSSVQQAKRKRILIVERDDLYSGLVVDDVLGMQHFLADDFVENCDQVDPAVEPFVRGRYTRGEEDWMLFSPFTLAKDPRFLKVAS